MLLTPPGTRGCVRARTGADTGFTRHPQGTLNSERTGGKSYYYLTDADGSVLGPVDNTGTRVGVLVLGAPETGGTEDEVAGQDYCRGAGAFADNWERQYAYWGHGGGGHLARAVSVSSRGTGLATPAQARSTPIAPATFSPRGPASVWRRLAHRRPPPTRGAGPGSFPAPRARYSAAPNGRPHEAVRSGRPGGQGWGSTA
jgi:hypothetical protein